MEIKFTVSGPAIGGAKSGINFNPADPRKPQVLRRWFKAVLPLLKHYYGTGGDLFIDEIHEVIPITNSYGLLHPQEGVVNGHFHAGERDKHQRIANLQQGVSKIVTNEKFLPGRANQYRIADLITGYGVAASVIHFYELKKISLKGKHILIQGWGNVGAAAGFYLSQAGGVVTGILDKDHALYNKDGFSHNDVARLINSRQTALFEGMDAFSITENKIWEKPFEIFIPSASSRLVKQIQVTQLIKNGLDLISCGANVPFADDEIFFGPISRFVDEKVTVIPDFISNCGMARVFANLMSNPYDVSDEGIFNDVSVVILNALKKIHELNNETVNITRTAFEIALQQLIEEPGKEEVAL